MKSFLLRVISGGSPVLRFVLDKDFRSYAMTKAPELVPIIKRAVATSGTSLAANPNDLRALINFAINDPVAPQNLKIWATKLINSDEGRKYLASSINKT